MSGARTLTTSTLFLTRLSEEEEEEEESAARASQFWCGLSPTQSSLRD